MHLLTDEELDALQRRADGDRRRARHYRGMLDWLLENASAPIHVEMHSGEKRRVWNSMDLEEIMDEEDAL